MVWDGLLIDGWDAAQLFTVVETFDGVEGSSAMAGANYSVSARDGEIWRRKYLETGSVSIGVAVLSADPATGVEPTSRDARLAQFNANWQEIKRRVGVRRRPLVLSRRMSLPDGQNITVTASAELDGGLQLARVNAHTGRAVLTFRLLDGCWFSEDPLTYTITAGAPVYLPTSGTVDSSNIVVRFTGGAGTTQRLTNESAGVWCEYNWSALAAGTEGSVITIDASDFTVTRTNAGVTVISLSRFHHGGDDRFMIVDPDLGDNRFTLSSGTAEVTYREAFL